MALMNLPSQDGWQWALAPLAGWPEAAARQRPLTPLQVLTPLLSSLARGALMLALWLLLTPLRLSREP